MAARGGSRLRAIAFIATAFGVAALGPQNRGGPLGFALSAAGLAVVGVAAAIAGEGIEEIGTMRWIRAGIAARLAGAAIVFVAVTWGYAAGDPTSRAFATLLIGPGLLGVAAFTRKDARLFADVRSGEALSLRRIGDRHLEIEAAGAAIRVPLGALLGVTPAKTLAGRGLLVAVERDAKIEGASEKLPWFEERVHARVFYLDEHQLGGDAAETATRVAEATARERGGYR
jgi:hypothetical protein